MKVKCSNCGGVVDDSSVVNCPSCGVKYWEKPVNEMKLHNLQDKYLETREDRYLGEMAVIIQKIIRNLILKKLRNSGAYKSEEDLEDAVFDSLMKVVSYYRDKPYFLIENSFTGYLSQVVLYPLYNTKDKRRQSSEISLQTEIGNSDSGGKTLTLEDKLSESASESVTITEEYFFKEVQSSQLVSSLSEFLEEAFYSLCNKQGLREGILNWKLVNHFLDGKSEKFFNACWGIYGSKIRTNYENTIKELREFLVHEGKIQEKDLE